MNSKDNKLFKSITFKIVIGFMIFIMFIAGISMTKPLIIKQQVVAAQEMAEKLTTPQIGEGAIKDKNNSNLNASVNGEIKIHFINVGQADSILIHQGNTSMLIDAGNNADSNTVKDYITQQGITKLDYVVGTHPHEDHIGGLDYIINSFDIGKIYMPKATSNTESFKDVVTAINNKKMKPTVPSLGDVIKIGQATATILAPNSSSYEDINNTSIVIKLTYGNNSFIFGGDAEAVSENEILATGLNINADLIKIAHHGSSSSTTESFLNKVNPNYAIISVGAGNSYGHPNKSTMEKLEAKGIRVYRTDENGTIVVTSDGNSIKFNTKPDSYTYSKVALKTPTKISNKSVSAESSGSNSTNKATTIPANDSKTVYHTPSGKSYHYDTKCRTLSRSKTILSETLGESLSSSHSDPCDICTN